MLYTMRQEDCRKQKKIIAVLEDDLADLSQLSVLEIGCAAGYGSKYFIDFFKSVVAVDVDIPAVQYASAKNHNSNLYYGIVDAQQLPFPDECFDVVVCVHIYEHVPDADKLMGEIFRMLRPGGVCYFAAGNRFAYMEPHYCLPLLSVVPKPLAHLYLRLLGRGVHYYENHRSLWGLKALVSKFIVSDYTIEIVKNPEKFQATDMLQSGSRKQNVSLFLLRLAYWLCPTYVWLLKKT